MKLLSHMNRYVKLLIIFVAILSLIGASNGSQYKVKNSNLNLSADLSLMALKVEENIKNDIYSVKESYYGDLTGYGADCPLCGGTLSCKSSLDVLHGNVRYNDEKYGSVRIVAASKLLPCGTIVRFSAPKVSDEPVVAIVLDRGVAGTSLDLLVESNSIAIATVGRQKINYDVLRKGW